MSSHNDVRPGLAEEAPRTVLAHPWRLVAVFVLTLLLLGRIVVQLADVQILDRQGYAKRASAEINRVIEVPASRGVIKDRLGNVLALDVERQSLYVVPKQVPADESARLAVTLGAILDIPSEQVLAKLIDTRREWVPLKRWLTPEMADKIEILEERSLYLVYEPRRFYPQGEFASHVIGATNLNGVGIAGVESSFDTILRGTNGVITAEVDINQNPIWARPYERIQPEQGSELTLTIDPFVQHLVEKELGSAVVRHGASGGTAIVMDVKTGAILGMASFPTFDPNDYSKVDPEVYNINPAVAGVYEPGSTFKILTVAAGLQVNAFDENVKVEDNGVIRRYDYNLGNFDKNGNGMITPADVLYYSSNVGAILFAEMMGETEFYRAVDGFGFGRLTGIELPGESPGLFWKPDSQYFTPINLNTNSFGQGISTTPLQIVRMAATVANNGVMMRPYVVQQKCDIQGNCEVTEPREQGRPISPDVAKRVRVMLQRSANHYVNARQPDTNWLVPGFTVGAKTGTSSIPDGFGGYENQTIGSVVGMAPIEVPRYAVLVKIDRPQDDIWGVRTALPVYRRIVAELMRYDRIAPNNALVGDGQRPGVIGGE
jgi:cell division protein FtsI (penicillin-binding protein 3)